jgi:predicted Zn-dependent protease with MMP-like domain
MKNKLVSIDDINLGVLIKKSENDDGDIVNTCDADYARCPMCESRNIVYGDPEPDSVFIYRTHVCDDCATTWEERYDLVRVIIEPGDVEVIERLM